MNLRSAALALCLASACSALPSTGQDGEITDEDIPEYYYMRWAFEAGQRSYDGGDWEELDNLPVFGFSGTSEPPGWLMGLEGGIYWTGGEGDLGPGIDAEFDAWEGFAGVLKSFTLVDQRLVLELGAGYSMTYAYTDDEEDLSTLASDDAWWSSGYGRAELLLRLGDDAWIGFSGRSARGGSAELAGADIDGDYDQLAFVLAARW